MRRRDPLFTVLGWMVIVAGLLAACAPAAEQPVGPVLAKSMPLPALARAEVEAPDALLAAEPAMAGDVEVVLPAEPPASCPVTTAPAQPFAPPAPWPSSAPYAGQFWYGSTALWALLPADGLWAGLESSGYGQKLPWWREGYFWKDEPEPALTVVARRLDAEAAEVRVDRATNGFHADLQSFMLTGVDFGVPGCWEVTGQYGAAMLSFVIWVAP